MNTPKKIFLSLDIENEDDRENHSNTNGEDESPDAVEYVRADEVERIKSERDALAAHIERLRESAHKICDEFDDTCGLTQELRFTLAETPSTSLARLKAQWQAEALSEAASRIRCNQIRPYTSIENMVNGLADELRWQAEGDE